MSELVLHRNGGIETINADKAILTESRSTVGTTFSICFDGSIIGYTMEIGDSLRWPDNQLIFSISGQENYNIRNEHGREFPIDLHIFGENGMILSDEAGNIGKFEIHK